ncbi:MAG TPA: ATP-binding protein [Polyangiaceae bacterium]|nr:ATP-binding protein [Polyangiaceae bacterium]
MRSRLAEALVQRRLREFPAVALVGPRQCGKTTLARGLGGVYFDLEQGPDRLRLDLEWPALVQGRQLVILDEAQAWPEVFSRLRGAIDAERRRNGRFLLLGSVAPALMTQVAESLAGRLSIAELTPFVAVELSGTATLDELWVCGGYPDGGVLGERRFPQWQRDYLQLLMQRDLPNWGLPARPHVTERLARMLAAVHGQLWNASRMGQSLGLNYQTVNSYLDYLVGAFLVRRLPPFHGKLKKRLVKAPKVYWRDSGLLHALMNVPDREALLLQPWVGASWEGFVIEQLLNTLSASGQHCEAFHLRTSDQYEIDLIVDLPRERWAIEVKLTTQPSSDDVMRLDKAADLVSADRRLLVSQVATSVQGERTASCNLPWLLEQASAWGDD